MIVGTGIDIAEVPRIGDSIKRFGDRFITRIFTEGEIRYCDSKANRVERYAARFAAKEAAMKAIGTGWNHGVSWRDIEVSRKPGGRPTIIFHGKAAEFAAKLGTSHVALSLTHTQRARHRPGHSRKTLASSAGRLLLDCRILRSPKCLSQQSVLAITAVCPRGNSRILAACRRRHQQFAALLLELALTRLFSVVLFYHFAFLAISIALLGLGSGGVFAYLLKPWLRPLRDPQPCLPCFASPNAVAVPAVLELCLHLRVSLELSRANFAPADRHLPLLGRAVFPHRTLNSPFFLPARRSTFRGSTAPTSPEARSPACWWFRC